MQKNLIETVLGAVVLIIAGGFLVFAYKTSDMKTVSGYTITAKFSQIDGLATGNDVKIAGVKVGTVTAFDLDPMTYQAIVRMSIDPAIELPTDTSASIISEGLLNGKFLSLEPGADEEVIEPDGEIYHTNSSQNLETLLGKFIFGLTDKNEEAL